MKTVKIKPDEIKKQFLLSYMNYHLSLLYEAIQTNNEEQKKLQIEQLEKIRQQLIEIEYFR